MTPWPENACENGLERRVSQFYTICDKNQLINKNIGKVMASLVLTCNGLGAPDLGAPSKDPSCPVGL
jgi:hypothetical protein